MRERPTVRQLEYLVAVADHRNFSRAAEACGVSQPALSGQIQELERRLGTTLFERGHRGVDVPTHIEAVVEAARVAIADVEDARALSDADISLVDAIVAAEGATQGKAFDAQIEDDSFSPEFEVSVVADGKIYDVIVDGVTGEVTSTREDRDD